MTKLGNLDQHRNAQAEHLINELGLAYELVWLPLDQINEKASLANQSRAEPVHEDLVERYKASLSAGALFPAIIAGEDGGRKGKVIADGNHRHLAAKALGLTHVPAYVFMCDTVGAEGAEFRAVTDIANARFNGRDNTLQERLRHAKDHVAKNGITQVQASTLFGVTPKQLTVYITAEKARERCRALGINGKLYDGLSDRDLAQLNSLVTDAALRLALEVIQKPNVTTKDVHAALRQVQGTTESARTAAQLEALDTVVANSQAPARALLTARNLRRSEPNKIMLMQLTGARVVIEKALAKHDTLTAEQAAMIGNIREMLCPDRPS